jgi:hypothetical protein
MPGWLSGFHSSEAARKRGSDWRREPSKQKRKHDGLENDGVRRSFQEQKRSAKESAALLRRPTERFFEYVMTPGLL